MIVSRNLLAQFIPAIGGLSRDQISEVLFQMGVEVEGFEANVEPTGLHYGIIREFRKVEGSDKLKLCTVFIPHTNQIQEIVCGASNVRKGLGVVVALPGSVLGNGKVTITERTFGGWGVTSRGMLCSYCELYSNSLLRNISDFEKGKIIELTEAWDLNREFKGSDLWLNDWVFDLFIPANRGDLHSVWGLSREMAKMMGVPNGELGHGGEYSSEQDPWTLKRVLLTNNVKGVHSTDFGANLDSYLFLAFNETEDPEKSAQIRRKSGYFRRLRDGFAAGKPLKEFSMRRLEMDGERALALLGMPRGWTCEGDWFVFRKNYAEVPEWRDDVLSQRDVADEIIELFGWDSISSDPIPVTTERINHNCLIMAVEKIREFFRDQGFFECTTFNLHAKSEGETVLQNPLSSDHCSLRRHALHELVEVLRENRRSKRDLYPVFELFEVQDPEPTWTLNIVVPESSIRFPQSGTKLCFGICDLQALLRKAARHLNINPSFAPYEDSHTNPLLPFVGRRFRLNILDQNLHFMGEVGYMESIDDVAICGLHCSLPFLPPNKTTAPSYSKYPPVHKDVSVAVSRNATVTLAQIAAMLKSDHFVSCSLLERYEMDETISYLFRIRFQSWKGTLTGADIQRNMGQIYDCIRSLKGVEIR